MKLDFAKIASSKEAGKLSAALEGKGEAGFLVRAEKVTGKPAELLVKTS